MSNTGIVRAIPVEPIPLDEVIRRWPFLRQSDLSAFDDCELASLFRARYENGWSTHPAAAGTIAHRVCGEILRELQRQDSETCPVGVALEILEDKLRQHGVAPEDRVRVPLRELPLLEMAIRKFAADNSFTIRNLIDVERRLETTISYRVPATGELVERRISGQLDALISRPPDEAVVLDFKSGWGIGPQRDEDADDPGVSYHGLFQLSFYACLVLRNYKSLNALTLREFYIRRTKARAARITRQDLPNIEQKLGVLVEAFDLALAAGAPPNLKMETLEAHGFWKPSPGKHCSYCHRAQLCPIQDDYKDGGLRTPEMAERAAGARQIARSIDKALTVYLKNWVDLHGPIPLKNAKGRYVLGNRTVKGGKLRFEEHVPEGSDRPATREAYDPNSDLSKAMRDSVEEARKERAA